MPKLRPSRWKQPTFHSSLFVLIRLSREVMHTQPPNPLHPLTGEGMTTLADAGSGLLVATGQLIAQALANNLTSAGYQWALRERLSEYFGRTTIKHTRAPGRGQGMSLFFLPQGQGRLVSCPPSSGCPCRGEQGCWPRVWCPTWALRWSPAASEHREEPAPWRELWFG